MLKRMKPSPAMAVALLALLVSLGGGAYAAVNLPPNSVGTAQIKNQAVNIHKIAFNSVGTRRIMDRAVTRRKLSHNSVWHTNLGRGVARAINLHDGAVTHPKLANHAVERNNLSSQLLADIGGQPGPPGTVGPGANNPAVAVVNVPAVGPSEAAQGYQHSGRAGDQGFFFTGRDNAGSAKLKGGQLVLHGVGVDTGTPQGSIGIAKGFAEIALGDLNSLSYIWHVATRNAAQAPGIHVTVRGLTADSRFASGFANLVYQPSNNGVSKTDIIPGDVFQSDGFATGARWFSTTTDNAAGTIGHPEPLSFFVGRNPHAVIQIITLGNAGTSGSTTGTFEAGADDLIIGFTGSRFTRYDFDG